MMISFKSSLQALREGDWSLHLSAIHDLILWCFAYDPQNYAQYFSCHYAEMANLEQKHSENHAYFRGGQFSVQIGAHNLFERILVDQTVEETINKNTQIPGGAKDVILKPNAIGLYYQTAESAQRSSFLGLLKDTLGIGHTQFTHPDLSQSRIRKDERDVVSLMDVIQNN